MGRLKQTLLFPLAAAINFFSVTALLIFVGLFGEASLAADIAIIQAAVVAIFLSFSGNARNLILGSDSTSIEKNLFYFRLMIMPLAQVAVFYLVINVVDVSALFIAGFIIRKSAEWIAELQLSNGEKCDKFNLAFSYSILNSVGLLLLALTLIIPSLTEYLYLSLYVWAILPIVFCWPYIRLIMELKNSKVRFSGLLPHMGSTVIIGVSMYVFRIIIIVLAGKALAGQMFTAYALGGALSSLYTYAIGPTLVLRKKTNNNKILFYSISFCILLGSMVNLPTLFWDVSLYPPIFIHGVGYSLIGGGIMLLAQQQRLYILQRFNKDVFVPDALINMLLIMTIPFAYYLFREASFAVLYLWSAILHCIFYLPRNKKHTMGYV